MFQKVQIEFLGWTVWNKLNSNLVYVPKRTPESDNFMLPTPTHPSVWGQNIDINPKQHQALFLKVWFCNCLSRNGYLICFEKFIFLSLLSKESFFCWGWGWVTSKLQWNQPLCIYLKASCWSRFQGSCK